MITIAPLLLEAESFLIQRDVDRAAALYAHAEALDPRSPLPRIGIARVALILGRYDEASSLLDAVVAAHPQSIEAATMRGVVFEAKADLGAAERELTRAVELDPNYGPAVYNLGRIHAQNKQWRPAFQCLNQAAHLLPESPDIAVQCGIAALRMGEPGEALRVLRDCVERAPFHLDATVTLGAVLVEMNELDLADQLFANAASRFTRQAVIPARRTALALRQGRSTEALEHVTHHVRLAPADEEAWLMKATLELGSLDIEAAEASVFSALRLNARNGRAHALLGSVYETARLLGPAERAYRTASKLCPNDWRPLNNLATLLLERPEVTATNEAKVLLEQALRLAPRQESATVLLNLAMACLKLGDRSASLSHAMNAAELAAAATLLRSEAQRFLRNFA